MPDAFEPFADDTTSLEIGGLSIENGIDRLTISGHLDLARDRRALEHATALRAVLEAVITALDADHGLPAKAAPAAAHGTRVRNPFA